ncbi:MAG: hypothetical protein LBV43_09920 [Prevotella sp.]|jgi:hypothetical protein|nr:hypothetical protein [Prevotella sp.]
MLTRKKKKVVYLFAFVFMVGVHAVIDKLWANEETVKTGEIAEEQNKVHINKCISRISFDFAYVLTNDNQLDNTVFYKPGCITCKQVINELK